MSAARVACVVPALNAAPTLPSVVAGLRRSVHGAFIVVIDDGSSDETLSIAWGVADEAIRFPVNRGKGAALRAGFGVALNQGSDVVLTVDADGQHDPTFAPRLVQALDGSDLAIGARARDQGRMPAGRRLTNRLAAAAVSRCIGRPVTDAQCGFRAVRSHVVSEITPRGDRYEFETEFLILAGRRGYRITFVPIPTVYVTAVPSQFRPLRDSARIIATLWRFGLGANS